MVNSHPIALFVTTVNSHPIALFLLYSEVTSLFTVNSHPIALFSHGELSPIVLFLFYGELSPIALFSSR